MVRPRGRNDSKKASRKLGAENHGDYRKLFPDPNFLECIGILVERGGMDFEIVQYTLGYQVPYRWTLWQPYVTADRDRNSTEIYEAFERLAKRMAKADPKKMWTFDNDNKIEWRGFME